MCHVLELMNRTPAGSQSVPEKGKGSFQEEGGL